jgi:hypothetical protein
MQEVVQEYNKVKMAMLSLAMVETVVLLREVVLVLVVQELLYSDILLHHQVQLLHSQTLVRLSYQQTYHK